MTNNKIQINPKSFARLCCSGGQIPNKKNSIFIFVIWILLFICHLDFGICHSLFAADEKGGAMKDKKDVMIELPAPQLKTNVSLEEAIYRRRSKRNFAKKDLTLQQVSQILWAAQGITEGKRALRSVPSAGALYPLEIYVVKKDGLFHYIPEGHKLKLISGEDMRDSLADAAWGQGFVREASVDVVICAVYSRVTSRYGERGVRYTDMEAGHAGQNIQLEAVSLGLGSCLVGAFDSKGVSALLNLPQDQEPLYIIPVGYVK
jgi:SagB-type dehydrogenase family enzyme